jgi:hypothetical protein
MVNHRRALEMIALLAMMLAAAGCSRRPKPAAAPAPAMKPAPPTPIDVKRAEIGGPMWDPAWDKIVELALPQELLSPQVARDVRPFCPRFDAIGEADKRAFWAYFFQALAGAEGGLKPTSEVRHSQPQMEVKDEVTGVQGRTEGLLQLAYADQKRYGCDFDWKADRRLRVNDPARTILQPKNNLECGVKILDQELIVQHRPLLSRTEYWSTLQPGTVSYRVFAKQMANVPPACRRSGSTSTEARRQPPTQQELISASR